jgi:hypothetical protein
VRDTSAAVSIARCALPGCVVELGVSKLTSCSLVVSAPQSRLREAIASTRPPPLAIRASAKLEQRAFRAFGYPRWRRFERRVAASQRKCGAKNFVPVGARVLDEVLLYWGTIEHRLALSEVWECGQMALAP